MTGNYKDIKEICWDEWWGEKMVTSSWSKKDIKVWDERASLFYRDFRKKQSSYIRQFIKKLILEKNMSVLDVGCGPGILTLPLAKKAQRVTALDISGEMLRFVKKEASENNLSNINFVQLPWEEVEIGKHIVPHDIVISSRFFPEKKAIESIKKLNDASLKAVYITMWVNHDENENFYKEVYGYIGKRYLPAPDYIFIYNMLYQLGIYAHLEFIEYKDINIYENKYDIFQDWLWRIIPENKSQENKLKTCLQKKFKWKGGKYKMELNCKWALIWWKK